MKILEEMKLLEHTLFQSFSHFLRDKCQGQNSCQKKTFSEDGVLFPQIASETSNIPPFKFPYAFSPPPPHSNKPFHGPSGINSTDLLLVQKLIVQ